MKTYTFSCGSLKKGIEMKADEKLGQVIFLGEEGHGRRYEKVALGRRNPAEVIDGRRVEDAEPVRITLPAKEGKPEKVFYILEKPVVEIQNVLVRVNTYTSYVKNGSGYWKVVAGQPEELISGYGAFGDAGRIGNWNDGLIVMRPGDALRVYPSRGSSDALWMSAEGKLQCASWQDYENILAVEQTMAKMAEVGANSEALEVAFASMPAYTWHGSEVTKGISLTNGATGKVVALGESGRGRKLTEVPLIGLETTDRLEEAAVLRLDEKVIPARYSWESPSMKVIYGLTQVGEHADEFLVRISTEGGYTRRGCGSWEVWKGNPTLLAEGNGADGDAGRIGDWSDGLWVLHEGDTLRVRQAGGGPSYALWVEDGIIKTERWIAWKANDGPKDPAFYVAKGTAPWGRVPTDWVGRVVSIETVRDDRQNTYARERDICLDEGETGELISIDPLVLNLGWDGRDQFLQTITHGTWVNLEADKTVRCLEGEDLIEREALKEKALALSVRAKTATEEDWFSMLEKSVRTQISRIAITDPSFDSSWSEISNGNICLWETEAIRRWVERTEAVMATVIEAENSAKEMLDRQNSGEVLIDFGGHFREMGRTGNAQYWVIRPDGSEREPDEVSYRKRYTSEGQKSWRVIQPEELALQWSKDCSADEHSFRVAHSPVGGCTAEQLALVEKLEVEIMDSWEGIRGLASGELSPPIGEGWGLWDHIHDSKPDPETSPIPEEFIPAEPEDPLSGDDFQAAVERLRGHFNG